MWRSWVDRLNTATTDAEETERQLYDAEKHLSPSELQQRQIEQEALRLLCSKAYERSEGLNENDIAEMLGTQILPQFVKLHETYIDDIENSVGDSRNLAALITKSFITGIRKVPEALGKLRTSFNLLNQLQSKANLYYHIVALEILTKEMRDSVIALLYHQKIPSVMIKLIRSFIDIPNNELKDMESEVDTESDTVASVSETADILADILRNLVWKPQALRRFVVEDNLFVLLRTFLTKPNIPSEAILDISADGEQTKYDFMWKKCIFSVLISTDGDWEVVRYLHGKQLMQMVTQTWKVYSGKGASQQTPWEHIEMEVELVAHYLQMSFKASSDTLFKDFSEAGGYSYLVNMVIEASTGKSSSEKQNQIYNIMENLVYVGPDKVDFSYIDGSPYQHEDFVIPQYPEESRIRNVDAFQILLDSILSMVSPTNETTDDLKQNQRSSIRLMMLQSLDHCIRANPVNYFITVPVNALPLLLEKLYGFDEKSQTVILNLLMYVMWDLNYVPFKELAVISLHLQSNSSSGRAIPLICGVFKTLLAKSDKFQSVFREVGLVNVFAATLSEIITVLHQRRLSSGEIVIREDNGDGFIDNAIASFDAISDTLVHMLHDTENAKLFLKSLKGNITDLIANDKTRKSAMSLVELLLKAAPLQTSAGDISPSNLSGAQDQVIQLMEMAQTLDKREILLKTQILNVISHAFKTTPSMRNSFRSFGGYITLISVLVSLEEIYTELSSAEGITTSEGVAIQDKEVDDLVEAVLDLLRKSMTGSPINSRHFTKNVTYGSLENAIKMTGVLQNPTSTSKLFGSLLAFATDKDDFKNIYVSSNQSPENQPSGTNDAMTASIEKRLNSSSVRLVNADVIISIMNLQKEIGANHDLSMHIFTSVLTLAYGNRHNQILLNRNGMILHLLERLYPKPTMFELSDVFEEHALTDAERQILTSLLQRLSALGMSYAELRYLFEAFEDQQSKTVSLTKKSSAIFLDTLRYSVESSRWPNFIHLDLSAKETSAITLDHVLPFPPNSGYTLLFWIHIEKQSESSRLTILDVIQNGETKLSVAVDGQNRHLHIEIQGRKQIMSFNAFQFQPNYWYHIALVHNRSRLGLTSSIMALYVNGSFLEQIRCPYNLSSGSPQSKLVFGGLASETLPIENRQVVWDLGPSYIIEDTLDSDIVNLLFNVGARYTALYQDSLKQFQSYETSTTLFLKLRSLSKASSKGDSSHSAFVEAMRGIGSTVIPEQKIVVALFAGNTISEDAESMIYPCNEGIKRFLASKTNLGDVTLNAAVPKINKALWQPNGLAYLIGSPLVVRPASVDDVLWKVGGFSAVLKLVEVAETPSTLYKTLGILFEAVRCSWRNSEDMERLHGYEILAYLLKQKRDIIEIDHLERLLSFIGKDGAYLNESVINNPYAYRYIVLNFEIWKRTSIAVQKAHLDQFFLFIQQSKFRNFNIKRLQNIHLVKKMLLAFRLSVYSKELVPSAVAALRVAMMNNWTTDSIRAVATFLASCLPDYTNSNLPSPTPSSASSPRTRELRSENQDFGSPQSSTAKKEIILDAKAFPTTDKKTQMCIIVMEMLHGILCEPQNQDLVAKYSSTITNKWALLFFEKDVHPYVVVLALRILCRLLILQGPAYMIKFRSGTDGMYIMQSLLKHHWNVLQVHEALVTTLLGMDISDIPLQSSVDFSRIFALHTQNAHRQIPIPELMRVELALIDQGLKEQNGLTKSEADNSPSIQLLTRVLRLLNDLHDMSNVMQNICARLDVIETLVTTEFWVACQSECTTAEMELVRLEDQESMFDQDVAESNPEVDTSHEEDKGPMPVTPSKSSILKRGGLSTLVTKTSPHAVKRSKSMLTRARSTSVRLTRSASGARRPNRLADNTASDRLVELLTKIIVAAILSENSRAEAVFVLYSRYAPPSTEAGQIQFSTLMLTHINLTLKTSIQLDTSVLQRSAILMNIAKYAQYLVDTVVQGLFTNGMEQTYDLLATILETWQTTVNEKYSSSSQQAISFLFKAFNRMVLLRISDLDATTASANQIVDFLNYCVHYQKLLLSSANTDLDFLRCFCYHLYLFMRIRDPTVQATTMNLWKLLMLQKSDEMTKMLRTSVQGVESQDLVNGFNGLLEMDTESFLLWMDSRKRELTMFFQDHIIRVWEDIVAIENKNSGDALKAICVQRINRLKKLQKRLGAEQECLSKYASKTLTWLYGIKKVELSKFTKALQDNDGHENFVRSEWAKISGHLFEERAIWGKNQNDSHTKWQLDLTESRCRMRLKMQPNRNLHVYPYLPKQQTATDILDSTEETNLLELSDNLPMKRQMSQDTVSEKTNAVEEAAAGEETYEGDGESAEQQDHQDPPTIDEEEDEVSYEEDKNRKVLRLLDVRDMVLDVLNVSQISGLDACEGLLLLCKNNLYLIDNFFQRSDGEVVEIWDAPKEERDQYLILLAQNAGMDTAPNVTTSGDLHFCRKWPIEDLKELFKRKFLFRDVALEIFFADGQNALITAMDTAERDNLYSKLLSRINPSASSLDYVIGGNDLEKLSESTNPFRLTNIFGSSSFSELTQRWERREITNFQYLMDLNTIAGRSYNDLTQYPVFPWILADYESEELDLENPSTFRDLSKPMGAQTAEREAEFADRYKQWGETDDPAPAFHYGTHYSSAMIVCSFLIRLEPFTQHYLKLQGGTFDHADRLFDSIGKAWDSASMRNMSDVRELIPEFFYLPEFLENVNKFNFGTKQGTGEAIDSVILPPWAHGDPAVFIHKHREALESEYVSSNLHNWIDLIFGCKQQGPTAVKAMNVFHHLSYENAVDLDAITDTIEKTATIGIIHNFGQTPRQLFKRPHPRRQPAPADPLSSGRYQFYTNVDKLIQSAMPLQDVGEGIRKLNLFGEKVAAATKEQAFILPDGAKYIEWGYSDKSLRFHSSEGKKLINIFENMQVDELTAATFADPRTLVTGGADNMICVWNIKHDKSTDFVLRECLRGHTDSITVITASRPFSLILSGSLDQTIILWDLNRMQYVRTVAGHESAINDISVNDTTGEIISICSVSLRIWSVNGEPLMMLNIHSDPILTATFYLGRSNDWFSKDLIVTGHAKGKIQFWHKTLAPVDKKTQHEWTLTPVHTLQLEDRANMCYSYTDITSLHIAKRLLLAGDASGKLHSFALPDCDTTFHYVREDKAKECFNCSKIFSVLERRVHCRTCGGVFCNACVNQVTLPGIEKSFKYCGLCTEKLNRMML
ncbi:hypothetical protein BC943DRAFT_300701 [Umbelopsis sp. AD052]|nr:hypothetical protein BC943DRAFT_300701 [Umbelopsis sp. AD052]